MSKGLAFTLLVLAGNLFWVPQSVYGCDPETGSSDASETVRWKELNSAGEKAYGEHQLAAAEKWLNQALSEAKKRHIEVERARTLSNLGLVYRDKKNYAKAEELLKEAVTINEKLLGKYAVCTGVVLDNLGELYEDEGKLDQAELVLKRALEIAESHGADNPHTAVVLNNLGAFYHAHEKPENAERYFLRAITEYNKNRPDDPQVVQIMEVVLTRYKESHRYPEFRKVFMQLINHKLGNDKDRLLHVARYAAQKADEFISTQQYDEAEVMYNRALAAFEAAEQKKHPESLAVRDNYVALLKRLNREKEAEQLVHEGL